MDRDLNQTVCYCANVTVGDIKKAVDDGASTYDEVQAVTLAGTGCGTCESEVKEIINEFVAERDN